MVCMTGLDFFGKLVLSRLNTEQSVGRSVQGFDGHNIFSVLLKGKVDENILVACNPAWFVGRCLL